MPEGMVKYIGINTQQFSSFDDCCAVVERVLDRSDWKPDYSRRLMADRLRFSDGPIRYANQQGNLLDGRFLYVDVLNQRPDIAALEASARLAEFGRSGGALRPCPIRSPLKATARPGFAHTIFPKSYEAFDLLCVGTYSERASIGSDFSAPAAEWNARALHDARGTRCVFEHCT